MLSQGQPPFSISQYKQPLEEALAASSSLSSASGQQRIKNQQFHATVPSRNHRAHRRTGQTTRGRLTIAFGEMANRLFQAAAAAAGTGNRGEVTVCTPGGG